MAFHRH